jgi:CBS domain-containing protein
MNVKTILNAKGGAVISVTKDDLIGGAAKILADNRIGAVMVLDGETIAGILSERDIVRGVAEQGDLCLTQTVATLMTSDVVTGTPDDTMDQIMAMMTVSVTWSSSASPRRKWRRRPCGNTSPPVEQAGEAVRPTLETPAVSAYTLSSRLS